ncbi:MRN complex-interacting protein [Drosophila novamexicana]|uniref:MRN complex-interacting protein n=1 Tax=Drosophila novamexicana TaxID=47314 RepID=UPI0011E5E54A|nr:MRN complex-interacting protein [Drosophila novamexicana]
MSQQIRVLQCVECSLYQVDIVKKTNKWECKVCRFKQMVHKEFFRGSGAECRAKVQQLNLEHGQKQQAQEERKILEALQNVECDSFSDAQLPPSHRIKGPSKWADYVDEPIAENRFAPKRHSQEQDQDEPGNISLPRKQSVSRKRTSQNEFVAYKKESSKWQNFL